MKPRPEEEGRRWLAEAENNWNAARYLRSGGFWALSCFHAQQSAEKAVKAYLYAQGAEEVWGHAVSQLLEDAATFDQNLDQSFKTGAALDKLSIPTRYPNGLPGGYLPRHILRMKPIRLCTGRDRYSTRLLNAFFLYNMTISLHFALFQCL